LFKRKDILKYQKSEIFVKSSKNEKFLKSFSMFLNFFWKAKRSLLELDSKNKERERKIMLFSFFFCKFEFFFGKKQIKNCIFEKNFLNSNNFFVKI
jgi:hypothetical protein